MTTSLPEHADLRAFASYHDEFRKRTFNKREARPWLFSPTNYFQFVCRLCSIGAPFINHRRVAANELLDKRGSVGEDVIRALECADAEDCVTALGWNIFGFAVHAGELPFTALTQPDLPGHQLYCHCAACETFRVEHALRRVVAVAPFDSLPADTRERVKQVMRLKRVKPFLPILEAWASFTSASLEPESKPKDTNVSTTPHLDNAEAWLATVRATKTTAGLKKLQAQLATMENTDLTDEDTERWEEIIRCVTNHRDTFRHSTQQHAVLNSMIDELSST